MITKALIQQKHGGESKLKQDGGAQADFAEIAEVISVQSMYQKQFFTKGGSTKNILQELSPAIFNSAERVNELGKGFQVIGQGAVPGGHIVPAEAFRNQHDNMNQIKDMQKSIERQNGNSGSNAIDAFDKIQALQQISVNHQGLARNSTIDNIHTPIPGHSPGNKVVLHKQGNDSPKQQDKSLINYISQSQTNPNSIDASSAEDHYETHDGRIPPIHSQKNKKQPHRFNKPENDPLILNVLNLLHQAENQTPVSLSTDQKKGAISPLKKQDHINKLGAQLKYKKYRYRNKNEHTSADEKNNIEIRNEQSEEIQEMKRKLKDIITTGADIPQLDRVHNQFRSLQPTDNQLLSMVGGQHGQYAENKLQAQVYQGYSRAKKNDTTSLNLSKIQDGKNIFSARRGTYGGFGNLDILNSGSTRVKHSPSVSPRANDHRTFNYKPGTFLDKLEANKKIRFESGTFSDAPEEGALPKIRAGSLLQSQKTSYLPDVITSGLQKEKERRKKRVGILLTENQGSKDSQSQDLDSFIQFVRGQHDQKKDDSQSTMQEKSFATKKKSLDVKKHSEAHLTELTDGGNEDLEHTFSHASDGGPLKLVEEEIEQEIFQNEELLNPALLQQNLRRDVQQRQLEIQAQQGKKQIVSTPMGPLSQQILQHVNDLQDIIMERNEQSALGNGDKSNGDHDQDPKVARMVQKKRSSTKTDRKMNSLASIYGHQQNIIKVPNQQYVTKTIKNHSLNNSELKEKRKLPTGKVSPLKKNVDYQNALKRPRHSLQKQKELLQATNNRIDNITLALLQGTPTNRQRGNVVLAPDIREAQPKAEAELSEPGEASQDDKTKDEFQERLKQKYPRRFKEKEGKNHNINIDARGQNTLEPAQDRTHSPESVGEARNGSRERHNSLLKGRPIPSLQEQSRMIVIKKTNEMGTSVYKDDQSPENSPLQKLQATPQSPSKDKVIIRVELDTADNLVPFTPQRSSQPHSLNNSHTQLKSRQQYIDDINQVNEMAQQHQLSARNGALGKENANLQGDQNGKQQIKVRIPNNANKQSVSSPQRRVVSLLKERGNSHLEIQKNFNNFGEYAEYVSPQMYDHRKIHEKMAQQNQHIQMQNVKPNQFKRSQRSRQGSQLRSESIVSNGSDQRSGNMDLLGFTTLNRGSVFQNPALLSNSEGIKVQDTKRLKVVLSPEKLKLQSNVGRQEKPTTTLMGGGLTINIQSLSGGGSPNASTPAFQLLSPSSKSKKLHLDYKNGHLPKEVFLQRQKELLAQAAKEQQDRELSQRNLREQHQQEYLKNYYGVAQREQLPGDQQADANEVQSIVIVSPLGNSIQKFQITPSNLTSSALQAYEQHVQKMQQDSPSPKYSARRQHEPNFMTDTQQYLLARAKAEGSAVNINKTIENSHQLLNQISPRLANQGSAEFTHIVDRSLQKEPHTEALQPIVDIRVSSKFPRSPELEKTRQITVISENSLEHATLDQYDQPWPTQIKDNNIDEWDDTGLYDQIIKKQNIRNAKEKKRPKPTGKTKEGRTPIYIKNDRNSERLSTNKQFNFKALNQQGGDQSASRNFPERNTNPVKINMQQQPNIYMTADGNKKMLTSGSQAVLVGTSALHQHPGESTGMGTFKSNSPGGTPIKSQRHQTTLRKQGHLASPTGNGQYFQKSAYRLENDQSQQDGPITLKSVSPQARRYKLNLPPHAQYKYKSPEQNYISQNQQLKIANIAAARQETQMTSGTPNKSQNAPTPLTSKQLYLQNLDRIIDANTPNMAARGNQSMQFQIIETEDIDVWLDRRKEEVAQNQENRRLQQEQFQRNLQNM